jgi:acyl-CoA-dependent ceramide synthase
MYVCCLHLGRRLTGQHFVTLWLIGWSYTMDLTRIGIAVYVTMDVSDIFLAVSRATRAATLSPC